MNNETACKIITFYSYKGGTGRSMALANIAWLLASNQKRVLVLDWDLEAPGLHRYFRPFLLDKELISSEGIIDFVNDYATEAIKPLGDGEQIPDDWYVEHADILRCVVSLNWKFPQGGLIDFVPAGKQGPTYAARVNSFNWQNFYDRLGGYRFFEAAKARMRAEYDYVLIDSRTGVSDTAGICTVQMPDSLVVCFTFNNQSIEGAAAVTRSIYDTRLKVSSESPLHIFPVPTRVDQAEKDKLEVRKRYARWKFDPFIEHISTGEAGRLSYWGEVEVPYIPYFAYEEILATFKEDASDPKTVLAALSRITSRLAAPAALDFALPVSPDDQQRILAEFAQTPDQAVSPAAAASTETATQEQVRLAETVYAGFPPDVQAEVKRILTRLVRVAGPEEGVEHSRLRVKVKDIASSPPTISVLVERRLLVMDRDTVTGEQTVEIASEALVRNWKRLHDWIAEDMDFLVWRQKLREPIADWEKNDRKNDFLPTGALLRASRDWLSKRRADLNESEVEFINQAIALESPVSYQASPKAPRAFIIRPFGTKGDINFDAVEEQLIGPALDRLDISGRTTIDILRQGNIHIEMFQRLLTADLIVADLSIHNANVFYQLGIRHALRDKRTFLIRSSGDGHAFDLQADRYCTYDKNNPAASIDTLVTALRLTMNSEAVDSPVFQVLPNLHVQDRSRFLAVPFDFREEVERATAGKQAGDLELLAAETRGFEWESEGLCVVGRAQLSLKDYEGARNTWESIRGFDPSHLEANMMLGTIYLRLGDLRESNKALERALDRREMSAKDRAEIYSLLGRNAKASWKADWSSVPPEQRRRRALLSPFLRESYQSYATGYDEDLNHFYSGLNALAMLTVMTELAAAMPDVWEERFESAAEGHLALQTMDEQVKQLSTSVNRTLKASKGRQEQNAERDVWLDISEADLAFLTSKKPARIAGLYSKALTGASDFVIDSVRSQLLLYDQLEVLKENVQAALSVIESFYSGGTETASEQQQQQRRILLFTGHMIDAPDRANPRFPAEKESAAKEKIREAVRGELNAQGGMITGIAGGASGGDILFHEVCAELGIPTQLYLALPRDQYINSSVRPAGPQWVERFYAIYNRSMSNQSPVRVLAESGDLPRWLRHKPDYSLWQRSNLWMLHNALAQGRNHVTLVALWDGRQGDGAGGTSDLVKKSEESGAKTIILYTTSLFELYA